MESSHVAATSLWPAGNDGGAPGVHLSGSARPPESKATEALYRRFGCINPEPSMLQTRPLELWLHPVSMYRDRMTVGKEVPMAPEDVSIYQDVPSGNPNPDTLYLLERLDKRILLVVPVHK